MDHANDDDEDNEVNPNAASRLSLAAFLVMLSLFKVMF